MMPIQRLAPVATVLLLLLPSHVSSAIFYQAVAGFGPQPYEIFIYRGDDFTPASVDSGDFGLHAPCPAPGSPNFFCGRARGAAGINGGRIFLRAASRLKRTDAGTNVRQMAAYGGARVTITSMGTNPVQAGTSSAAAFYFRLDGSIVATRSDPSVIIQAFSRASLYTNESTFHQCSGQIPCPLDEIVTMRTQSWDMRSFVIDLRTDVSISAPDGFVGYSAETVTDFADTMELVAVALLDENDQPRLDVTVFIKDENGDPLHVLPNVPPDPSATATATPVPTATPGIPTPTATPLCASPPCEICQNCLDDDGDQLVDGDDAVDCPAANGGGVGLPDARGKAALKCQKAIAKAGAKLAVQRLSRVQKCVQAELVCLQEKLVPECHAKAAQTCAKELAAVGDDEAKLTSTIVKACGAKEPGAPPVVSIDDLRDPVGLGYGFVEGACALEHGVAGLVDATDLARCLARQHACRVDVAIGAAAPRAYELLRRAGRDVATEFPCLALGSDGDGGGLGDPKTKGKAASACEKALAAAGAKLVKTRLKGVQQCATAVFACAQVDAGDAACVAKARATCAKAFAGLGASGDEAALVTAVVKGCTGGTLTGDDLRSVVGLGFDASASECAALGVPSLDGPTQIGECVGRRLGCRARHVLEFELPRLRELMGTGQVAVP